LVTNRGNVLVNFKIPETFSQFFGKFLSNHLATDITEGYDKEGMLGLAYFKRIAKMMYSLDTLIQGIYLIQQIQTGSKLFCF